jgi:hypothetical protein
MFDKNFVKVKKISLYISVLLGMSYFANFSQIWEETILRYRYILINTLAKEKSDERSYKRSIFKVV